MAQLFDEVIDDTTVSPVSYLINEDTLWNSGVYRITENVVILPSATLRIQGNPNSNNNNRVRVLFATESGILVHPDGTLLVENAILESDVVVDHDSPYAYKGGGVQFVDSSGGTVTFKNVVCQGMSTCIRRTCCGEQQRVTIQNSTFVNNDRPLTGYSGSYALVEYAMFEKNNVAISGGDWSIHQCLFRSNEIGVDAGRTMIRSSIFIGHTNMAARDSNGGEFIYDVIFYNNRIGIGPGCCGNPFGSIQRASFIQNEIAIQCPTSFSNLNDTNFIQNSNYSIYYTGTATADLRQTTIYWGTISPDEIADSIYDAFDGSNAGLVLVDDADNEDTVLREPRRHTIFEWTVDFNSGVDIEFYPQFLFSIVFDENGEYKEFDYDSNNNNNYYYAPSFAPVVSPSYSSDNYYPPSLAPVPSPSYNNDNYYAPSFAPVASPSYNNDYYSAAPFTPVASPSYNNDYYNSPTAPDVYAVYNNNKTSVSNATSASVSAGVALSQNGGESLDDHHDDHNNGNIFVPPDVNDLEHGNDVVDSSQTSHMGGDFVHSAGSQGPYYAGSAPDPTVTALQTTSGGALSDSNELYLGIGLLISAILNLILIAMLAISCWMNLRPRDTATIANNTQ